ncbi:hypothetical protein PR048_000303 [Dryococelus australis]|uniref:Uncharacterized protein n=1 Tax=Dryococelus australis TaxID=614101 RepID=A0ABQ9IE87_9NEOP|nr:hypothetical protein PR048_000303 [Dryococelus australis]
MTYSPTANGVPFAACSSQSEAMVVPAASCSQSENGYLEIKGNATSLFSCVLIDTTTQRPITKLRYWLRATTVKQVVTLVSHQREPGSTPGRVTRFSQVGIMPDDAVVRRVFSCISRFPAPSFRRRSIFTSITLVGSQDFTNREGYKSEVGRSADWRGESSRHMSITPRLAVSFFLWSLFLNEAFICLASRNASNYRIKFVHVATVAEQLACSPPTKAIPVQSPAGSRPKNIRMWESCRTMPLVGGFSHGSPVSPALSFRCCSIITSIALLRPCYNCHVPCPRLRHETRTQFAATIDVLSCPQQTLRSHSNLFRHVKARLATVRPSRASTAVRGCRSSSAIVGPASAADLPLLQPTRMPAPLGRRRSLLWTPAWRVGTPFANQRLVTHSPPGKPANRERFAACRSQSGKGSVPRTSCRNGSRVAGLFRLRFRVRLLTVFVVYCRTGVKARLGVVRRERTSTCVRGRQRLGGARRPTRDDHDHALLASPLLSFTPPHARRKSAQTNHPPSRIQAHRARQGLSKCSAEVGASRPDVRRQATLVLRPRRDVPLDFSAPRRS